MQELFKLDTTQQIKEVGQEERESNIDLIIKTLPNPNTYLNHYYDYNVIAFQQRIEGKIISTDVLNYVFEKERDFEKGGYKWILYNQRMYRN